MPPPQKASRRGRGGRAGKKRDVGRAEWSKTKVDKRGRNEIEQAAKRQRVDRGETELPIYATKFSEDAIAAEERRPKKKVAVLIGYSGTGYKGLQLAHDQKTIEGDLFQAFVAAGAISKANADDPKKSSLVRCARTDKGVHAAGNVISLKLIVEDDEIIKKINDSLSPQIRVWGYERTNNSFSAYQLCDSRMYEYLIPTHAFLPPHPSSYLGRKILEHSQEKMDVQGFWARQTEVEGFWEKVDMEQIQPILDSYDEETRSMLERALFVKGDERKPGENVETSINQDEAVSGDPDLPKLVKIDSELEVKVGLEEGGGCDHNGIIDATENSNQQESASLSIEPNKLATGVEGLRRLRQEYIAAKRAYRIPASRLERVRKTLQLYEGTRNFHNYTIQKSFSDPSAKRVIKSFVVSGKPVLISGTEWVSLKVQGQSFMMHQIRKMVGMLALVVRCGADPKIIMESYGAESISIPKAPSLGLLLERPVFDSYNKRAKNDFGREVIDFSKFDQEMEEFKQREIYERMWRDEENDNIFGNFFNHIDNFPAETFLFVTSGGIEATKGKPGGEKKTAAAVMRYPAVDSEGEEETVSAADKES